MASVPGYAYAQAGDTIYVNLFVSGTAAVALDDGRTVDLVQETRYPWDGAVRLTVNPRADGSFTIAVRLPGWARNEPVPSDLYRFLEPAGGPATVEVNGTPVPLDLQKGYVSLKRDWRRGDVITLLLPMPVRRVVANERVAADRGRVALQRGPIVYCAEWPDNPGGHVRSLVLPDDAPLAAEFRPELLNGVTVITGQAIAPETEPGVVKPHRQAFMAIPYYAWANRGPGEMAVWLQRAEPPPDPKM
jgi:DUF1680 family protein